MQSAGRPASNDGVRRPDNDGQRQTWNNRAEAFLALVAAAIGASAVLRFPYLSKLMKRLVWSHLFVLLLNVLPSALMHSFPTVYWGGGVVNLIQYVFFILLFGFPLYALERTLGQYTGRGLIGAIRRICPLMGGLGISSVFNSFLAMVYYNQIVAYALHYLSQSYSMPWDSCDNVYNTANCTTPFSNRSIDQFSRHTTSAGEYFYRHVLQKGSSGFVLHLLLAWLGSWAIAAGVLSQGVRTLGRFAWPLVIIPLIGLFLFFVVNVPLDGAWYGIRFLVRPGVSYLYGTAWSVDTLFGLSLGMGVIVSYSSYNRFSDSVYVDSLAVPFIWLVACFLSSLGIFALLGYFANATGLSMNSVAESGLNLAHVSLAHVFSQLGSALRSMLFYTLFTALTLGTQLAFVLTVGTALRDEVSVLGRLPAGIVYAGVCTIGFLAGLVLTTGDGVHWFTVYNILSYVWTKIFCYQQLLAVFIYGADRLAVNAAQLRGQPTRGCLEVLLIIGWFLSAPTLGYDMVAISLCFNFGLPQLGAILMMRLSTVAYFFTMIVVPVYALVGVLLGQRVSSNAFYRAGFLLLALLTMGNLFLIGAGRTLCLAIWKSRPGVGEAESPYPVWLAAILYVLIGAFVPLYAFVTTVRYLMLRGDLSFGERIQQLTSPSDSSDGQGVRQEVMAMQQPNREYQGLAMEDNGHDAS